MEATTFGTVYVFNCFNEAAELCVGGYSAGTIGAWANSGAAVYQPASIAVPRIRHSDEGAGPALLNDGSNLLSVRWDTKQVAGIAVPIPKGNISIEDDLVLYLSLNQFILMCTDGFVLSIVSVDPERAEKRRGRMDPDSPTCASRIVFPSRRPAAAPYSGPGPTR